MPATNYRAAGLAVATVGACLTIFAAAAGAESAEPAPVPERTAISLRSTLGVHWGTDNEHEPRSGLSLTKLYLADYALRHGDAASSSTDRELAERMIRYSDDAAAALMAARYPRAIDEIAAEYRLTETHAGPDWGSASTSTADMAGFLENKLRTDPSSPLFEWMASAGSTAADGTEQDWGTARLPAVLGTKWGWSDIGEPEVASASYGPGFAVTAHTRGTAAEQTADVLDAIPAMAHQLLGTH
ncbi:hypothetical protein [Nocardia sp. NPDC052566]|uniref:hypothetical protein n=1 Tax=Nocardia sp. NPDC052566 TaxID=3364330 RepID=UPI0037C4F9BE